ncbi:alpha/beta hydrolase [Streptomyces albipurpureus]|uniref:Alpha/beta hydrolase n=1 Tax=Streptomyces albipurpureus TaxID=2897419 RepID=A0ABT0ULD6_9ACTN|nr:alpha/beta hydrolase [Streptomyces sp. CWNU-1]MCM2389046.1 alpha/beta hydrolase [Streptomyces sp. CWNU-1]
MPTTSSAVRAVAFAASLAVLLAAGCSDGGDKDKGTDSGSDRSRLEDFADQRLKWTACPPPSEAEGGGPSPSPLPGGAAWQCSFMDVPLDYGKPDGETMELALIRARAVDEQNRIGSLIFNFGGPGGSGVATLPSLAPDYATLRGRYDLVSFDPRGVGRSVPVECEDNQQLDVYYAQDATPDNAAEERTYTDSLTSYAHACEENSGTELPHVGTTNAARDMELMRQVLGDDKLYYFGISYGTELGGVYAHLYPGNVGRAVFDAVVDPTKDAEQSSLGQTRGFQLALTRFAENCVARGDECPLPGTSVREIQDGILQLLRQLDKKPIPGIGDRELTQTQATNGIAQSLYSTEYWELLEQGLDEADGGDGALLLALSDAMNGRSDNGHYSNSGAANAAINCVDSKERYSLKQTKEKLPEFRAASPVFGDYLGWGLLGCTKWPVPGEWTSPDVSAPGAPPILIIGNTGDPATPYEGAKAMAQALGKGVGIELTYDGDGHGAYNSGNRCVQQAVNAYLLQGTVPASGTVCKEGGTPQAQRMADRGTSSVQQLGTSHRHLA